MKIIGKKEAGVILQLIGLFLFSPAVVNVVQSSGSRRYGILCIVAGLILLYIGGKIYREPK